MSVASPCTGICTVDAAGAYCVGCLRTLGEIGEWSSASEARRAAIVADVAARRNGGMGRSFSCSDRRDVMTQVLDKETNEAPHVRDARDASDDEKLRRNPSNEDAKLDVGLDETFPGSDAPSNTQPGKGKDPAPSSGFDPEAEAQRSRQR